MPKKPIDPDLIEIDLPAASFPSDALTMKRLRTLFSDQIDQLGWINNGQIENSFFYPSSVEEPEHLLWLHEMMCAERNVAAEAFEREAQCLHPNRATYMDDYTPTVIAKNKQTLERHFQFFKLADSPETARLLIQQCQDEGRKQAQELLGRGR